jgi:very-short-patch-repair endonuclease
MSTILNNIPLLKETRKYLRRNMTEAELILWSVLKDRNLCGRKFRRQHSIGYYVADLLTANWRFMNASLSSIVLLKN